MIETQNILVNALDEAMETMAFLTIIPEEEGMMIPERVILAEMSFSGPCNGTIQILAGADFAEITAENIGAMDEVTDTMRFDAMKELANVTCGLVIPMLASSKSDVFDLTVPAIKADSEAPGWDEFVGHEDTFVSNVEGYAVATKLIINDQPGGTGETL
jgi:chemotaxis protein CheY-P-specific phosphatase CheC